MGGRRCGSLEGGDPRYDVILSDLRMPGLGGHDLLAHLRATQPDLADRVIFFTGDALAGGVRQEGGSGTPLLIKPLDLAEVALAVEARGGALAEHDGLARLGGVLLAGVKRIRDGAVSRLLHDPLFSGCEALPRPEMEGHECSMLTSLAQVLTAHAADGSSSAPLLSDAVDLLGFAAARHGAQRARLGWSDAMLAREFAELRGEIADVLRASSPPGLESFVPAALSALHLPLAEAEQRATSALRG